MVIIMSTIINFDSVAILYVVDLKLCCNYFIELCYYYYVLLFYWLLFLLILILY